MKISGFICVICFVFIISISNFGFQMYCWLGCQRAEKIFCALNWVLCSVCWDTVGKFSIENYLGIERKGEIINRLKRFLFMMGVLYTFGNVSRLNLGQRIHCEMTSVDFPAQTNTQTCPGASTLHLQCSCRMEIIQLCPSTFVFVYPYCSKAWFNSPEISHRISRCCADPCDPVTSTVMICVCAVACWEIATLAASFSPA